MCVSKVSQGQSQCNDVAGGGHRSQEVKLSKVAYSAY